MSNHQIVSLNPCFRRDESVCVSWILYVDFERKDSFYLSVRNIASKIDDK